MPDDQGHAASDVNFEAALGSSLILGNEAITKVHLAFPKI